jgi:saccharopine dehydrogenase (NADP+, L-glutamate forming)
MTIHWCGTGLSAVPGLRRLIEKGYEVKVWNRTVEKARQAVGDLTDRIAAFSMEAIAGQLQKGDIVVSMLPGDWHVPLAQLCIQSQANFVSSSYIAPEMAGLDGSARQSGVALVNEVGLDPGIDHLMAHWLVSDYLAAPGFDAENDLSFVSYCGGIPKNPNPFKYKFSWSPVGVLKALCSPSKSILDYAELNVARPWEAISSYQAPLPDAESFEVYPNRDSLPFMAQYHFDRSWKVKQFVRGTLRLNGWAKAWSDVFVEVETADEARLKDMSDQFWRDNAYGENDPDRVIMCVGLKAEKEGRPVYHKTWVMDAYGDVETTAMARLVSVPVSLAVEAVANNQIAAGVSAAPSDIELVESWLAEVRKLVQHMQVVDHASL